MVEVVGHRGAKGLLPENTLPGFEKAIALGCGATECDVHLSADGILVVCHDETVDRTTDGKGRIAQLTLSQLRDLDAGGGARIPTLQEVLALVKGRTTLLIELKGQGTADPAVAAVRAAAMAESVVFSCFDHTRIARVRELGADLRITGIAAVPDATTLDKLAMLRVEYVDINWKLLSKELVDAAHARGLRVRGWNPDTADDMRVALATGIDSLSSNLPDLAMQVARDWEAGKR